MEKGRIQFSTKRILILINEFDKCVEGVLTIVALSLVVVQHWWRVVCGLMDGRRLYPQQRQRAEKIYELAGSNLIIRENNLS